MNIKAYFFLFFLFLFSKPVFPLYLLAVGNNTGELIKFDVKTINSSDDQTDVFIATKAFMSDDTKLSIEIAKDVVCSIFDCKGKDFLVKIYGNTPILSGPSGGSAFATGMVKALLNLPDKEVGITGTINPGGVIGPVGGVNYKVEAAKHLQLVIIPLGEKIYRDPLTNKIYNLSYPNVKEAGTLFDIIYYVWNIKIKLNNSDFKVPLWYITTMRNLSEYFCSLVNENVSSSESYYAQASKCFTKLIKKYREEYKEKSIDDIILEEKNFEKIIETYEDVLKEKFDKKIEGLNELQLYMVLYKRLNDAKDNINKIKNIINNIKEGKYNSESINFLINLMAYTKARILSIKEWMLFFKTMPKGIKIDYNQLTDLCIKDSQNAILFYNYLIDLYATYNLPTNFNFLENLKKKIEKYRDKDPVLCIAYSKELKSNVDSFLSLMYLTNESLKNFYVSSSKVAEFYIKRNKEFPMMAYAYWNYGRFLAKEKDYISAINYNYQSINLATMIYEINKEINPIIIQIKEEINYTYLIPLIITIILFVYLITILQK